MNLIFEKRHTGIHLWLLLSLLVSFNSCNQNNPDLGESRSFEITSDFSDATYDIQVRLPLDYESSEKYETVYILDPDWYFDHTVKESARLSEETAKQNVITVGISHGNPRTTDYIPTTTSQGEGGAENFTYFLQEELIPYVEDNFSADTTRSSRVILGHSAGGIYAAYAFTMHSQLFGNYLMLSPGIWYDDGICLEYESENRNTIQSNNQTVFISVGELEATQLFAKMFHERLIEYDSTNLAFHTVKGKDHASSANQAISEALSFYFGLKEK